MKLIAVLNWHAQNFSDDCHRQRQRVLTDQIHFAFPCDGIEQIIRQRLRTLSHPVLRQNSFTFIFNKLENGM